MVQRCCVQTVRQTTIEFVIVLVLWTINLNLNVQATNASVRKIEYCAIVGAIALDHVITNDF